MKVCTYAMLSLVLSAICGMSQTNIINVGPYSGNNAQYIASDYICNIGFNPAMNAVYRRSENIFNFGADCGWQSQWTDSWNFFNIGLAAGESVTASQSYNIFVIGSEAAQCATFYHSGYHFLLGHNTGESLISYNTEDVYAMGGLQGAQLYNSQNVLAIGDGAGDGVNGMYTNVIFLGEGSTLGSRGKDIVVAGPQMKLQLGSTNQWQFGEVLMTPTNALVRVNINGQDLYLEASLSPL